MKKRILIDGRFVGVGESISRYVLETLSGILELDKENSYTLLVRPEGEKAIEKYPEIIEASNLKIDILDIPHYSVAEQTKLLQYLEREKYDLVHFTQFNHPVLYRGKFVTTIHDLTMIGHLHRQRFWRRWACRLAMWSAVKDSDKIISVSQFTKDDILEWYRTNGDKIKVIYNGLDHNHFNLKSKDELSRIKDFKEKNGIANDYILYTGAWKRHKNILGLLKAFEQICDKGDKHIQLVLVGKIDAKEPEVTAEIERINSSLAVILSDQRESKDLSKFKAVITTGFVDEDDLPIVYAGALLYVMPSFSEGFGWPPLEAMACGTPVVSSNLSCMPEVLGDAALYFDPYNVDEMAKTIEKVSSDEKLRKELVEKGLKQVTKYDWDKTAKETLEVYRQFL